MITLENYVLENEISDVTIMDVYAEQAIAEMNVISSLLDCYCKQEMIQEYTSTDGSEFGVFMEGEKWDKFKSGASETWNKFKDFLKGAAEAFIVAVQTVIAKIRKVPANTIKASIDKLRETMDTDQNIAIRGVNAHFVDDLDNLIAAANKIGVEMYDLKLATDNGSSVTSAKFESILKTIKEIESDYDISNSGIIKRGKERRNKDENTSTTMSINDIDQYINDTLAKLEQNKTIETLNDLIKTYKKLIKADAKAVKSANADLYNDIKDSKDGIYNPANMKKVVNVMKLISREMTILVSEYSRVINSILTKANKEIKKYGQSDAAMVGMNPKDAKEANDYIETRKTQAKEAKEDKAKIPANSDTYADADDAYDKLYG